MSESPQASVVNLEERGLAYRVRILIRHPSETLDCLTTATGISPKLLQRVGDPRVNPAGTSLPGLYPHSTWSWWEQFRDSRDFSVGVARAIDILAPVGELLGRLRKSGGEILVILELRGERNIGAIIETRELTRMVELGIDFGIEVFPNTNG
jgi:hypothetical protein